MALEALNTEIENLLVNTNLMSLLALANPGTRREYTKILCSPARIAGLEGNSYDVSFRKNVLKLLRDILQGYDGEKDLLVPGLIDEVSSLMIQFRHKMCLD